MPEGSSVKAWTEELRNETRAYAAQPYQQLAAACRAAGQDRQAREVLIAQRKHETKRGGLGPVVKAWAHITDWTIGYGWKPWKALIGLTIVVVVAVVIAILGRG
jgi:hypothetical protein